MGKTIERRFECDGPFILRDGFVEKIENNGMQQKTFQESMVESQEITPENAKQFIEQHIKEGWKLRHARYVHKNAYDEKEDIKKDLEFDYEPLVIGQEFIELGMPLIIKYKVTKTIEAI